MFCRVADNAALADFAFADFKLWLNQSNTIAIRIQTAGNRRKNQFQGDKRDIYGGEVKEKGKLPGFQITGILSFQHCYALILPEFPDQLIMPGINRTDVRRAMLQ